MNIANNAAPSPHGVTPLRAFSWASPRLVNDARAASLSHAKTILYGVGTCLRILQEHAMQEASGDTTFLNPSEAESLLLLVVASVGELEKTVEAELGTLEKQAAKLGGAA